MREDGTSYHYNHLHWHNGSTCHGAPTLDWCMEEAVRKGWTGKVLERTDTYRNGEETKCYSLVCDYYDHYAKQGKFVAVVEITARKLEHA